MISNLLFKWHLEWTLPVIDSSTVMTKTGRRQSRFVIHSQLSVYLYVASPGFDLIISFPLNWVIRLTLNLG